MSLQITEQPTPNPHAMKYILSEDVLTSGKVTFNTAEECAHVPLAAALFGIPKVTQVHFFENVITVTQLGYGSLNEAISAVIRANIDGHDADFNAHEQERLAAGRQELSPDVQAIEKILDEKIRPALQMDGGDLDVVSFDKDSHRLVVAYQGACGTCPSAAAGTMMAIQGILRDDFDPQIDVVATSMMSSSFH